MENQEIASRRGRASRRRGHQFERDIVIKLKSHGYPQAARILEYQLENCQGVDITGTGDIKIQAKCMAKVPNIPQVFKEFTALKETDIPVVMFKVTNKGEYAALRLDDYLALIENKESASATASRPSDGETIAPRPLV